MCSDLFFFFKQKTAYEMRISDWSSDVCSSDLIPFRGRDGPRRNADRAQTAVAADRRGTAALILSKGRLMDERIAPLFSPFALRSLRLANRKIGRASCRERVCQYV